MSGIVPPQRPQPGSVSSITPPLTPLKSRIAAPTTPVASQLAFNASQIFAVQPEPASSAGHKVLTDDSAEIDPDKALCKILAAIP
ncbi:hypothetical protein CN085_32935 [Sinorhizobium meliloti]|uniref:hypothetical protein n=1 Tax=Rhizobium meliloti TaxID=382 RepID=UPI000FDA4C92|nr:hypothetical protein [Sinorhizobium meliloti]RVP06531.1 hypothetical protein CN085_32935 [Sinorhizobium meliloti]